MKILFVVASLREGSFNRQLAKKAEELIGDRAEITYLDYSRVPFVNTDKEFPAPAEVQELRDTMTAADGVWIFSPEYNWSYPGHLKNLLDWMSRPLEPGKMLTASKDIKITVSNVAGGFAGANCRAKLFELFNKIQMKAMTEPVCGIKLSGPQFMLQDLPFSEESEAALNAQIDAFLEFLK